MTPSLMLTGGCLCGTVRYRAEGELLNVRVCHCRLCQKALGASFNARVVFARDRVQVSGPVAEFPSSPELMRGFCPRCGTTLFSERRGAGVIGLTLGSLDEPELCPRPAAHIWMKSRQSWVPIDDGSQHFSEGFVG